MALIDPTLLVHNHYYIVGYDDFTDYEYPAGDTSGYTPMFQIGD